MKSKQRHTDGDSQQPRRWLGGRLLFSLVGSLAAIVLVVGLDRFFSRTLVLGLTTSERSRVPLAEVDHTAWSELLQKYVDRHGQVAYGPWSETAEDLQRLDDYLNALSRARLDAHAPQPVQLAFWINAYNALTIRGILREYPTTSIRNHTPRRLGYHIWHDLHLRVADRTFSLHQIEHEVLRPLGDPRIHFAINCASQGCPRLARSAYTASEIETQLDHQAREFFADATKFRYDTASDTLYLSEILRWFADDFGADEAALKAEIADWLPDDTARRLAHDPRSTIRYLPYDWRLNDVAP